MTSIKDYDAYLFDWDGTVAETLDIWLVLWHESLASHGKDSDDYTIVRHLFGDSRNGLKNFDLTQEQIDDLLQQLHPKAVDRVKKVTLYTEAKDMLLTLKHAHKKLALITSSYRELIDSAMHNHGLIDMFDVLVTGEDVKAHKPDPEGIDIALKALGVPKNRALMLGDSDKDLRAARNAGIDSLLFYPDKHVIFHKKEELQSYGPKYVISTWQELIDDVQ
jgi:HAD superfamily hydrolase (TIGR01549 family)